MEHEQEEPLLTLHEAAAVLGIGAEQVRRHARAGALPHRRARGVTGKYLIRQSAVQEFAAHRAARPAAPLLDRLDAIERRLDALESARADPSAADAVLAELADLRAELPTPSTPRPTRSPPRWRKSRPPSALVRAPPASTPPHFGDTGCRAIRAAADRGERDHLATSPIRCGRWLGAGRRLLRGRCLDWWEARGRLGSRSSAGLSGSSPITRHGSGVPSGNRNTMPRRSR